MSTQVIIYPNPFMSTLSFEVIVDNNASAIVQVLDEKLKIIKMLSWHLKKGTNKTSINDLDTLPPGDYFVDIKNIDGKNLFSTKLVKVEEADSLKTF
jgi:hypothetical protein